MSTGFTLEDLTASTAPAETPAPGTPAAPPSAPALTPPISLPAPDPTTRTSGFAPMRYVPVPLAAELQHPGLPPWKLLWWKRRAWEGRSELYQQAVMGMADAIAVRRAYLKQLYLRRPIVLAPASPKGGAGKTATATCLAAVIGDAVNDSVLIIDANPDWGGAAKRLGVSDSQTLSLTELYEFFTGGETDASTIRNMMWPTENGVRIVRSDDANIQRMGVDKLRELIDKMRTVFSAIILDTGTAITSPVNLACYEYTDSLLFPLLTTTGRDNEGGSVDGCKFAREQLQANGFADKVASSVTVALGIGPTDPLDPFREATDNRDGRMLAVPFDTHVYNNQVVRVVPFDRQVIEAERGVDRTSIAPHTQLAYLDIAIAAYHQAASASPTPDMEGETP